MLLRLGDWLLDAAIRDSDVAAGIKGDLSDERQSHPAIVRDLWYLVQACSISVGYLMMRLWERRRGRGSHGIGQDLGYAARLCRRRPGFTLLAVLTLGVGIGSTTAMLTVVDRVLLRQPPYPDPEELVAVWNTYPGWQGHEVLDAMWNRVPLSYPEYLDWRDGQAAFRSVAIYTTGPATLTGLGEPALIAFGAASASLFPLLGVPASIGRSFDASEEGVGGARVALVSHEFWQTRLGATPDPLGRVFAVDGESYELIGVLPAGFRLRTVSSVSNRSPEVWVPAGLFGDATDRGWRHFEGIGRLRPGASLEQAEAETGKLLWGNGYPERAGIRITGWQQQEVARARPALLLLLAAAVVLMTIASVNVATLFTAEAGRRRHEFSTRRSLGASRWRLARQLVFESGSIGLLGAMLGAGIATMALPPLLSLTPPQMGLPAAITPDARVLLVTASLGIVVGIVFGVVPSLLVARSNAAATRRSITPDRTTARAQRILVSVEAALAVLLVAGAGLLGRTLHALHEVDPGFTRENIVAVSLPLSGPATQPHLVRQLAQDLIDRLEAIPGIDQVSGASAVPFSGEGGSSSFDIEGRPVPQGEKKPEAHRRNVLPGYHEMLGISLIAGRTFTPADRQNASQVVIVSQSLADRFWPGERALGRFIVRDNQRREIVGIVSDVLHSDLTGTHQSTFYVPFYQEPPNRFWLIVRASMPMDALIPTMRRTVAAVAPGVAVGRVNALGRLLEDSTAPARFRATLVAIFGACSLLLAAVGIFGVTARMVSARQREMGIRIALGARNEELTRSIVVTEAKPVALGVLIGLGIAAFTVRALDPFLFGVSFYDVPTFLGTALLLGAIGIAASYVPARFTAKANPLEVLRAE